MTNAYKSILTLYLIAFRSVTKCIPEKAFVQTKKIEYLSALFILVYSWEITFFIMEHNEMISAIKWFSVQFYYCEHNVRLIRIVLILFLAFVFISNDLTTSSVLHIHICIWIEEPMEEATVFYHRKEISFWFFWHFYYYCCCTYSCIFLKWFFFPIQTY